MKDALKKYSEFKEVMYYKENAISTRNTYNKPYIFWVARSLYFETWVSEKLLIWKWENLLKNQSIFLQVIILVILISHPFDYVFILLEENWCWSILRFKGSILLGWTHLLVWPVKYLKYLLSWSERYRMVSVILKETDKQTWGS